MFKSYNQCNNTVSVINDTEGNNFDDEMNDDERNFEKKHDKKCFSMNCFIEQRKSAFHLLVYFK
jgi:hypothetical protein